VQLAPPSRARAVRLGVAGLLAVAFAAPREARAQVAEFDTTHTIFYEAPTRTNMFVYSPAVSGSATSS